MNLTNVSWADLTSNPVRATNVETGKAGHFCERVSPGCAYCYASEWNEVRYGTGLSFLPANRNKVEFWLNEKELAEWQKPKYAGKKVFVCDMTDLFGEWVPDEWLDSIFAAMALAPEVTFQLLTKRIERARAYLTAPDRFNRIGYAAARFVATLTRGEQQRIKQGVVVHGIGLPESWPLLNCWLGVSAENQHWADERIPVLLETPAAVRFVSVEPMLGPIDLTLPGCTHPSWYGDVCEGCGAIGDFEPTDRYDRLVISKTPLQRLDWVICGGESGPKRRPFALDWARSLRDQCKAAGVAFWMKQDGALRPGAYDHLPADLKVQEFPR